MTINKGSNVAVAEGVSGGDTAAKIGVWRCGSMNDNEAIFSVRIDRYGGLDGHITLDRDTIIGFAQKILYELVQKQPPLDNGD